MSPCRGAAARHSKGSCMCGLALYCDGFRHQVAVIPHLWLVQMMHVVQAHDQGVIGKLRGSCTQEGAQLRPEPLATVGGG